MNKTRNHITSPQVSLNYLSVMIEARCRLRTMRISNQNTDRLSQLELWSQQPTDDRPALSENPTSTATLIQAIQDATTDLSDLSAAADAALSEVETRLSELRNQPELYYQCRAISWQILADRWMMLAAANANDAALSDQLCVLAQRAEDTALKLVRRADSMKSGGKNATYSGAARMALNFG